MGYSPWGQEESDTTEQLTLSFTLEDRPWQTGRKLHFKKSQLPHILTPTQKNGDL